MWVHVRKRRSIGRRQRVHKHRLGKRLEHKRMRRRFLHGRNKQSVARLLRGRARVGLAHHGTVVAGHKARTRRARLSHHHRTPAPHRATSRRGFTRTRGRSRRR